MEGIRGKQCGGQVIDILVATLPPGRLHLSHADGVLLLFMNEMEDWDGHYGRCQQHNKTYYNTTQKPALASHYPLLCHFFLFAYHPFLHKKDRKYCKPGSVT